MIAVAAPPNIADQRAMRRLLDAGPDVNTKPQIGNYASASRAALPPSIFEELTISISSRLRSKLQY